MKHWCDLKIQRHSVLTQEVLKCVKLLSVHCDCPAVEEQYLAQEAVLLSGWLRGREADPDFAPGAGEGLFMGKKVAGAASLCHR